MDEIFPIIVAVVVILLFVTVFIFITGRKANTKKSTKITVKNRNSIIRDSTKKLTHDPHNVQALTALADLYYTEHLWDKAFPHYEMLTSLAPTNTQVQEFEAFLRFGICALKLGKNEEAANSLSSAYKLDSSNFEVCFNLAQTLYVTGAYDKAIPFYRKCLMINESAVGVYAPLGLAFFKAKHYKECLPYIRRALNEDPENKEILFSMAEAMLECNYGDKALKIFMHLRPDPEFGARSSLEAGMIHTRMNQMENALLDFEIGMKLENVPNDILIELNYRAANCYIKANKIANGLACLNKIQLISPNYKDVNTLIQRYKELVQNTNLHLYLSAPTSDFVAICRKLVGAYHAKAFVKFIDIAVSHESVEIICEVDTSKWEEVELFRFYRSTGSIGELYIRDFHGKIRDSKCDRGFCVTAGSFSDEAKKFIEGRPIDLIEKAQLMRLLKMINITN